MIDYEELAALQRGRRGADMVTIDICERLVNRFYAQSGDSAKIPVVEWWSGGVVEGGVLILDFGFWILEAGSGRLDELL